MIFCSGLVTGAVLVKQFSSKPPPQKRTSRPAGETNVAPQAAWHMQQKELMRRMEKELNLKPEQRERIEKIMKESQERTKPIREKIAEEMKSVREQVKAELSPEQREKYEASLKKTSKKDEKKEGKQDDQRQRNPAKDSSRTNQAIPKKQP